MCSGLGAVERLSTVPWALSGYSDGTATLAPECLRAGPGEPGLDKETPQGFCHFLNI